MSATATDFYELRNLSEAWDAAATKRGIGDAYCRYLREGTGLLGGVLLIVVFFIVHGLRFMSGAFVQICSPRSCILIHLTDVWLKWYVDDQFGLPTATYVGVLGGFAGAIAIGVFARGFFFANVVLLKSKNL